MPSVQAGIQGGKLWGSYCDSAGRLVCQHTLHQFAQLAYLLRDPLQFPVVMVTGSSFSACSTLYRALPSAAYMAYVSEATIDQRTAFSPAASADLPRPSSVRLVPHTSALLGPEVCEKIKSYVNVVGAATESVGAAVAKPSLDAEKGADAFLVETKSVLLSAEYEEELRQSTSSAFTEQFLSRIEEGWRPRSTQVPHEAATTVQPARRPDAPLLPYGVAHDGRLHGGGCGSSISPRDMRQKAWAYDIHWVVPCWHTGSTADLQKAIDSWRSVLSPSRSREVASLLVFINDDVVVNASIFGSWASGTSRAGQLLSQDSTTRKGLCCASPSSQGCRACAALWRPLALGSQLWAALSSLRAEGNAFAEASSACASSVERTDTETPARRTDAQRGAAANPPPPAVPVKVPVLHCWNSRNLQGEGRSADESICSTTRAVNQLMSAVNINHARRRQYKLPRPSCLRSVPGPMRKWQWLLQQNGSPYPVPPSGAKVGGALPYMLVGDSEEGRRERRRAVRRNAVDAETLQRLKSGALSAALSPAGGTPTSAPLPSPRYFTTLVSDAGPLLTSDGCLTDLFVMEFQPALQAAEMTSHHWGCMERGIYLEKGVPSQSRCRARLELTAAAAQFTAAAIPSVSLTHNFLGCATRFLCSCGRGRSVLAWPLTDPAEGSHCLRVAFTLSYEIHADPRFLLQCLHKVARRADGGQPQMRRPAFGDGSASCTAAVAARRVHSEASLIVETMREVIDYILRNMRSLGWVLVWQEDHHRWPTAVAPPHMHPGTSTLPPPSLRGSYCPGVKARVAASLEKWRHEQLRLHRKRYDADVPVGTLSASFSNETVEPPRTAGQDAAGASLYTSLDVWQAALIPEDAGVYLWEGQTVFLDDGRQGVIVEFRPPPAELFTSAEQHTTAAKRMYWHKCQRRYSDFIRFYRWRQDCCAAVHRRRVAAAFTGLPHYVRQREMTNFPVVELLHLTTSGKRPRVQVLPIRALRTRVAYPRVRIVSVAEQKALHKAQDRPMLADEELRDEVWHLPSREPGGRSASDVTLLRLPLTPFRIETVASLYVSHVMRLSAAPLCSRVQKALCGGSWGRTSAKPPRRLNTEWACHHRSALAKAISGAQRVKAAHHAGQINWSSLTARPRAKEALRFVFDSADGETAELLKPEKGPQ
ncbi:hypothetical protein LSCM1_01722 [Leishmania martiniquensis]|uniref:Uncharacterized protein n=1 Tax=Leishmania martiniquensis TaxID=1580590 RepID=A0A836GV97_9TRYP|nr:hypothetical protein LSCM1_01722 [Leishmania martiniquensis]